MAAVASWFNCNVASISELSGLNNLISMPPVVVDFMIADATEAIRVSDLRRFPKNYAPPFVYLTGSKNISVSAGDIKTLRWYLEEEGGMIFADNGGDNFNAAFRSAALPPSPKRVSNTICGCASAGSGVVGDDHERLF